MSHATTNEAIANAEPKRVGLNGRFVLHAIRRRPLPFLGILTLTAAAFAVVWFFLPLPKVTAAVVFQVATRTPSLLTNTTGDGEASFLSFKQSQASLVKSRLTLLSVTKQPGVGDLTVIQNAVPDRLSWLDQNLKVDIKTGSEFMRVTIEGDDGEELRTLLEAVAKEYLSDVDKRHHGERRERLKKLEETRRVYQDELNRFHKQIDAIAYLLGSKDGPTLVALDAIQQNELRDAARERTLVRDDLRLAELELYSLGGVDLPRSAEPSSAVLALVGSAAAYAANPGRPEVPASAPPVPDSVIEELLRDDPVIRSYELELESARKNLGKTESLFEPGASSPAVVKARDELKAVEAKRDKYRIARRPELESRAKEKYRVVLETRKDVLRQTVERHRRRDEVIQNKITNVEERIGKSNQHRIELENLKRNIEQTENLSRNIAGAAENLKVDLLALSRVSMAEAPFIVPGIEGNRRLKYALMGSVAVFLLGFVGLVGWETRNPRVTHSDDVTSDIGVRLLGTVPPFTPNVSGTQDGLASQVLVEAVDTVRTMLLHGTPASMNLRTVLVTSAEAQEGKTSLSGHLAISLARAGYRTLLVDGDLQSPSAHYLYEMPASPGLCEVLRGELDPADAVHPSPIPGLSILTAGKCDLSARQALGGERWRRVRKDLESQFEFLIIDSAPLLLVSDTLQLAREADAVVLSVLLGVSQISHVTETANRLKAIGANLTGAVVNGVWHKAYRPAYGERTASGSRRPTTDADEARPSYAGNRE